MSTKQLTDAEKNSIDRARMNIQSMDGLLETAGFNEFMEGFRKRADQLADEILHNDTLQPEEREMSRNIRKGILEVLRHPAEIIRASRSILRAHGMD